MKRIVIFILLILVSFGLCVTVQAKTLNEMKQELSSLKAKYGQNQSSKKMTQSEINSVEADIDSINSQIDGLNNDITSLNADIEKRNEEIKNMNEEIKKIVHYYQLSSSESFYLEYVFNATDFTDFIYRLAISEQLSEYREKTIGKYNKLIDENKKKINEIAEKKASLKSLESELSTKVAKLETQLAGITMVGVSIEEEIKDLEESINLYEKTYHCSGSEQISACIYRNTRPSGGSSSSGGGSAPNVASSSGFYVPISDWTRIYPFHHHDNGLDMSTSSGHAVHPIADGTVIDIWSGYSCGGNMVWVLHNVNGRKYTSAYFHLSSYTVHLDQEVTHNDVIGYSGGSAGGSDRCTTGAHLHLQVATGHYYRECRMSFDRKIHICYSSWNANSIDPAGLIF